MLRIGKGSTVEFIGFDQNETNALLDDHLFDASYLLSVFGHEELKIVGGEICPSEILGDVDLNTAENHVAVLSVALQHRGIVRFVSTERVVFILE